MARDGCRSVGWRGRERRVPDTAAPLEHRVFDHGSELYLAGAVVIVMRDRPLRIIAEQRLAALIADAGADRSVIEALLDCEFSLAYREGGAYVVAAFTHPWRMGRR